MKALRRSIKGDKDKQPQISIAPKSAVAIVPPKKVIRALYDYEAQSSQELSFSRGDFFHVIGRENDPDWYEACNPALPDARGLVPVAFFQALGRTERDSAQSDTSVGAAPPTTRPSPSKNPDHDSGYAETPAAMQPQPQSQPQPQMQMQQMQQMQNPATNPRDSKSGKSGGMVYGIVMYDFQAERADELQAKAGEAIIVIAQSNPEWFVAKPIGRLGGPGLIPVSFVEIRDMASNTPVPNPQEAVKRAGIPRVEEWKKMAAEYKNSSITLGKFEVGGGGQQQSMEQGMERMSLQPGNSRASQEHSNGNAQPPQMQLQQQQPQQQQQQQQQQQSTYNPQRNTQQGSLQQSQYGVQSASSSSSQLHAPLQATIPRYCFAEEKYWFVIEAVLEDGRHWELSRYYEDFYDFQIALLTEFPAEAGNTGTQKRTLPYMPGPVNYVTDAITEGRLHNLDAYVKNLLAQPQYIARCNLVKQFFAPREGDIEIDAGSRVDDEYRLSAGSQPSSRDSQGEGASRQSSRNNLNGNPNGNGNGYGMAASQQPRGPNGQPQMLRQPSSLSQPSQSSLSPGITQAGAAIKVKLSFNGDLIAIRVPSDIQFSDLYQKIRERLKIQLGENMRLSYKNDPADEVLTVMASNPDLDFALQRTDKLLLYVDLI